MLQVYPPPPPPPPSDLFQLKKLGVDSTEHSLNYTILAKLADYELQVKCCANLENSLKRLQFSFVFFKLCLVTAHAIEAGEKHESQKRNSLLVIKA